MTKKAKYMWKKISKKVRSKSKPISSLQLHKHRIENNKRKLCDRFGYFTSKSTYSAKTCNAVKKFVAANKNPSTRKINRFCAKLSLKKKGLMGKKMLTRKSILKTRKYKILAGKIGPVAAKKTLLAEMKNLLFINKALDKALLSGAKTTCHQMIQEESRKN